MAIILATRLIDQDAQFIWSTLSDFGGISKFNPFLSHSKILDGQSGASCGVGAHRQCDMRFGASSMREKIVDWQEGQSYTVSINQKMLPVRDLRTTIGVVRVSESQSLVFMKAEYIPKFWIFGGLLNVVFLRWMMAFMFGGVLRGLEKYVSKTA